MSMQYITYMIIYSICGGLFTLAVAHISVYQILTHIFAIIV